MGQACYTLRQSYALHAGMPCQQHYWVTPEVCAACSLPCLCHCRCCAADSGRTRFKQLVEWCGKDFDGLIVFDESKLCPLSSALELKLQSNGLVVCAPMAGSMPSRIGWHSCVAGGWGGGRSAELLQLSIWELNRCQLPPPSWSRPQG